MNTVTVPVHTDDELREMNDEKVQNLERSLKGKIESLKGKGVDTRSLEVEYCYVKRETEHRRMRRKMQEKFSRDRTPKSSHRGKHTAPRKATEVLVLDDGIGSHSAKAASVNSW